MIHPERECPCTKSIEQKQIVKYNFGVGGIHYFLVCSDCLKDVPWNRCVEHIIEKVKT